MRIISKSLSGLSPDFTPSASPTSAGERPEWYRAPLKKDLYLEVQTTTTSPLCSSSWLTRLTRPRPPPRSDLGRRTTARAPRRPSPSVRGWWRSGNRTPASAARGGGAASGGGARRNQPQPPAAAAPDHSVVAAVVLGALEDLAVAAEASGGPP